jgi:uncharacterized membrane protein
MTSTESEIAHPEVESFFPAEQPDEERVRADERAINGDGEQIRSEEARLAAVMSYIPFLCFIPLLTMRHNNEALFHARQGLLIFLIELGAAILTIDKVADFLFRAVLVLAVVAAASGVYLALQGRHYRLPVIGNLADRIHV